MDKPYDETVDVPDSEDIATPRLQQSLAENFDRFRGNFWLFMDVFCFEINYLLLLGLFSKYMNWVGKILAEHKTTWRKTMKSWVMSRDISSWKITLCELIRGLIEDCPGLLNNTTIEQPLRQRFDGSIKNIRPFLLIDYQLTVNMISDETNLGKGFEGTRQLEPLTSCCSRGCFKQWNWR